MSVRNQQTTNNDRSEHVSDNVPVTVQMDITQQKDEDGELNRKEGHPSEGKRKTPNS